MQIVNPYWKDGYALKCFFRLEELLFSALSDSDKIAEMLKVYGEYENEVEEKQKMLDKIEDGRKYELDIVTDPDFVKEKIEFVKDENEIEKCILNGEEVEFCNGGLKKEKVVEDKNGFEIVFEDGENVMKVGKAKILTMVVVGDDKGFHSFGMDKKEVDKLIKSLQKISEEYNNEG